MDNKVNDMTVIYYPFMYLALAGFLASFIAHVLAYVGVSHPFGYSPWPLHAGIFIVWLPAILVAIKISREFPQKDMWKATLRGCPIWMKRALYAIFGYALLSFFISIILTMENASDGNDASVVRGFSGHWMVFYYAAFAILHSAIKISNEDPIRRCKDGHAVKPTDRYCPECGGYVGSILEKNK